MNEYKIDFHGNGQEGWIVPTGDPTVAGVVASNIGGSGINLEIVDPFGSTINVSSLVDQAWFGIPEDTWKRYWALASFVAASGKLTGFEPGEQGELVFFGVQGQPDRGRKLLVNGVEYTHDNPQDGEAPYTPVEPTTAPFTADASGEVALVFDYMVTNTVYAGLIIRTDIVDVSGPTDTRNGDTYDLTVAGDNLVTSVDLTDGSISVEQVINSQSYDAGTDTRTVSVTTVRGAIPYGGDYQLDVTFDSGGVQPLPVNLLPTSGWYVVDVVEPVVTEDSVFHEFVGLDAPQTGMQLHSEIALNPDGTVMDGTDSDPVGPFQVELWRDYTNGWGETVTVDMTLEDGGGGDPDPDPTPGEPGQMPPVSSGKRKMVRGPSARGPQILVS